MAHTMQGGWLRVLEGGTTTRAADEVVVSYKKQ